MAQEMLLFDMAETERPRSFHRAVAAAAAARLKPALERHAFPVRRQDGGVEKLFRIAGSLRRGRPEVRDVDVVAAIPSTPEDMLHPAENPWSRFQDEVKGKCDRVILWGPDHARFLMGGVPFDLYFTRPGSFAVALLLATGSGRHNLRLGRQAGLLGMRFHIGSHQLIGPDRQPLRLRSEAEVFQALKVPYRRPEERK